MALPQIQEMDPWLEEDEEVFMSSGKYCKGELRVELRKPVRCLSLTRLITNVAKVSFYGYLFLKLISKSVLAREILRHVSRYSSKYGSMSTAVLVFFLYLLKRFQKKSCFN